MNYKRNYRFDEQAKWIQELAFSVHPKPQRFYMNDAYTYREMLESGVITADEHGAFHGSAADPKIITRYSFSFYSAKKGYLSIIVTLNTMGKFWFNRRLVGIGRVCSQVLIVPLKMGENRMDIDVYCRKEPLELSVRTEGLDSRAVLAAGTEDNLDLTLNRLSLYMERSSYPKENCPKFILMPHDQKLFSYHSRLKLQLQDHDTGRVVLKRRLRFGKLYKIPHKKLVYDPRNMNRLDMIVTCKTRDGQIVERRRSIYKTQYDAYLPELLEKARNVAEETTWSPTRRKAILSMASRIETYKGEPHRKLIFTEILKDFLCNDKDATEGERYIKGNRRVFFHDKLDDTENFYRLTLPQDYDSHKEHPLFLICCTKEYGSYGTRLENAGFDDMIMADVSVRGVTLGSYVGEAALLQALSDIQKSYRIDPNRIYIGGYSNGASAALAIAQAYPHLFAGVYALSGRAEKTKMCNLANINTVLITSHDDEFYENSVELLRADGTNRDKTTMLVLGQHNHYSLQRVWLNKQTLSEFFRHEREPYPTRFAFVTDRNRHLQAYWIQLHGIKPSAKACKLVVDAGRSIINITVRGATGLTIDLPPFIDKSQFIVRINGKETEYVNITSEQMHFVHGSRGFKRVLHPGLPEFLYKGNGLLDVYMDPLCVVIPETHTDAVQDVAQTMSRPHSNGTDPEIAVWYKTYTLAELLDNKQFFESSMIVVGKEDQPFYRELDAICPIQTNEAGYCYQDVFAETPYCCMQIIPNPWNRSKSILYITFNDEKVLKRNLFTRSMIIPSYIQGRHPYLNEPALLFDGKNYMVIKTPNGPLEKAEVGM